MKVNVTAGDISQVSTGGLVTAINSTGMWNGGIDRVIRRVAGDHFHRIAGANMPLQDGTGLVARGSGKTQFANVVFVVDDLKQPLQEIVYSGLKAASDGGLRTVTLPTIRMGVMLGVVERSRDEALNEMIAGVNKFRSKNEDGLDEITFVVYGDEDAVTHLRHGFC